MRGAWKLGTLSGIGVYVHWSFLLLPTLVGWSAMDDGVGAALTAILFVLAVFGCIVLHELGHALAARRFGIPTRDITLLPIGGVARLARMPRNPWQELVIALAGPLVNVVIAVAVTIGLQLNGGFHHLLDTDVLAGSFLEQLVRTNVALVVFNLIPAFPMDGGRVLRSLLAFGLPYLHATQIAAGIGQTLALGLGLLGLFAGQLTLVLLAGFVFFAARGEVASVRAEMLWQQPPFPMHAHPPFSTPPVYVVDAGYAYPEDEPARSRVILAEVVDPLEQAEPRRSGES